MDKPTKRLVKLILDMFEGDAEKAYHYSMGLLGADIIYATVVAELSTMRPPIEVPEVEVKPELVITAETTLIPLEIPTEDVEVFDPFAPPASQSPDITACGDYDYPFGLYPKI